NLTATLKESLNTGSIKQFRMHVGLSPSCFMRFLDDVGQMPLPPYISRPLENPNDKDTYQTVFSAEFQLGSAACPTAGLHFNHDLIDKMKKKGIEFSSITLHVGLGTFLPVKAEDLRNHKMHEEIFSVPKETIQHIEKARVENRPILYVGTTTLRCLEAFY